MYIYIVCVWRLWVYCPRAFNYGRTRESFEVTAMRENIRGKHSRRFRLSYETRGHFALWRVYAPLNTSIYMTECTWYKNQRISLTFRTWAFNVASLRVRLKTYVTTYVVLVARFKNRNRVRSHQKKTILLLIRNNACVIPYSLWPANSDYLRRAVLSYLNPPHCVITAWYFFGLRKPNFRDLSYIIF